MLLLTLIRELNTLYHLNLVADFIRNRFMEDDVFSDNNMDCMGLLLSGASHLSHIAKHTKHVVWREYDLTIPSWRITVENVRVLYASVLEVMDDINLDTVIVILQLFNNSVHIYRGQARRLETPPLARQEWCVPL